MHPLEPLPLEFRRLHLDLINYYKILNGLSPLIATDYFLIYNPLTSTRSDMPSLLKPLHASSKLSSSFVRIEASMPGIIFHLILNY